MKTRLRLVILKILSNPLLKRLRVFHLFLSVVSVMVIFSLIQGYVQLRYIRSVQQVDQKMSNTLLQFNKEIDTLKYNLTFVNENYLKRLSGLSDNSALDYTFNTIDQNLKDIKKIAQNTSADTRIAELVADPAQDLIKTVKQLKELAYAADTKENYLACETKLLQAIKDINNIGLQVEENSYNTSTYSRQASQNQQTLAIILLIIEICLAVLIGIIINFSISWPLREIIKSVRAMAEGDFTGNLNTFGCRESYEVVQELNTSLDSLRLLISQLNQQSDQIAKASENLKTAARDSGGSAEEVAKAMQQLAYAISNQAEQVTQTASTVDKLGARVHTVSKQNLDIANSSKQVTFSAQEGQKLTSDVADEINKIYLATKESGDVIKELDEASKAIAEISSEIREITDETSLLSLNASIEASRAGEQGKGFSVVAHSIGRLAERCRGAAQKIDDLTVHMMERAEQAVRLMEEGVNRVEGSKNLAGKATVTFESIFSELKMTLEKINDVAKAAQEMSEDNEKVIVAVANIAAISEESMASSEEVSASAEEQSAAAQEVTLLAENLLHISNEMKNNAKVFKV